MTLTSSHLKRSLEDAMTIPKMLAWVEQQPPKSTYDYICPFGCAMSEFLKAQGFDDPSASFSGVKAKLWNGHRVDAANDEIYAIDRLTIERPRTYGGLAVRMRDVLRARSTTVVEPSGSLNTECTQSTGSET